jgi:hypothetical protein
VPKFPDIHTVLCREKRVKKRVKTYWRFLSFARATLSARIESSIAALSIIDLKRDGNFWLNMRYFNYCQGLTMANRRFADLFGGPRVTRNPILNSGTRICAKDASQCIRELGAGAVPVGR